MGWRSRRLRRAPAGPKNLCISILREICKGGREGHTISRQRVSCRLQAVEVILAIGICPELSPQVIIGLILWILEVVFAV